MVDGFISHDLWVKGLRSMKRCPECLLPVLGKDEPVISGVDYCRCKVNVSRD